jgi:hypothetical protein
MSEIKPETGLALTEQAATERLAEYLKGKCLTAGIVSCVRLDGLTYWAFVIDIPITFVPFMPLYGKYGFHVYDSGEVKQVAHYPDEAKE